MGQTELKVNSSTFKDCFSSDRQLYTREEVDEMVKVWSTGQVAIMGMAIGSSRNKHETTWIIKAIYDALNYPEKFKSPGDNFGALMCLRNLIKGKNAQVLGKWYNVPVKYEYRNKSGVNAIVDSNNDDEVILPFVAGEILDIIADLNKSRDVNDIFDSYNFYHENVSMGDLEKFKVVYQKGLLNKCIRWICSKSNELGGFNDCGVDVIRNRLTSQYLFDDRKRRG